MALTLAFPKQSLALLCVLLAGGCATASNAPDVTTDAAPAGSAAVLSWLGSVVDTTGKMNDLALDVYGVRDLTFEKRYDLQQRFEGTTNELEHCNDDFSLLPASDAKDAVSDLVFQFCQSIESAAIYTASWADDEFVDADLDYLDDEQSSSLSIRDRARSELKRAATLGPQIEAALGASDDTSNH